MIEVNNLAKKYGDFVAVSDISFSAKRGEIVGFLGPNGAGKTSSLRMLSTYLPPSSGQAIVAGYNIITESEQVRRNIGYLPETPPLYGEMTVKEYLTFVARIKGVPAQVLRQSVDGVMERCFLEKVSKKLCQHLSRGYRQRVGLAQAVVHNPPVIILDEPTSGLDPAQIIEIRQMIASLGSEHTVILSTHILPEVTMVCNKVVIINNGRIALEDRLDNLLKGRSLEQVYLECVSREEENQDGSRNGAKPPESSEAHAA